MKKTLKERVRQTSLAGSPFEPVMPTTEPQQLDSRNESIDLARETEQIDGAVQREIQARNAELARLRELARHD